MKKLIILQTVTPDYRGKVFTYIHKQLNNSFELYAGEFYFENSIISDDLIDFRIPVKNHFFLRRRFMFQTGMWKIITKDNIMVLELNPRIVSNWIILFIRRALKKKTVLWGHAWPRSGINSRSDALRHFMRILSNEIIVYTNTQKKELQDKMLTKVIKTAPNSVFYKKEMQINQIKERINNIIYVGRLTKSKKALFLVQAFNNILRELPQNVNLIIVGEGEEKTRIENYIIQNNLLERVKIKGHVGDYTSLKKMYDTSLVSVSPGYIGLSVTQSFGFGVPMIISRNEKHSPEIEAAIENENSVFFETNNLNSLSNQILNFYNNKKIWINKRNLICEFCQSNYSVEKMAEVFIQYLNKKHI